MFQKIKVSFLLAFTNIRSNFFHTLLSILGIVIGVAALVAILSLIDGMEDFARKQIAETTSIKAIIVRSEPYKQVNGIRVRKDSFEILSPEIVSGIKLSKPTTHYHRSFASAEVKVEEANVKSGAQLLATSETIVPDAATITGVLFTKSDVDEKNHIAVVNKAFAKSISKDTTFQDILGQHIVLPNRKVKIIGVLTEERVSVPQVMFPITLLSEQELRAAPPELIVEAEDVTHVQSLKQELQDFIKATVGEANKQDFSIISNDFRVEQATKGFLLFRVIMGLIVGISVLVGGIGVMNVLLISVTERTSEIGIRKAVGANKRDIILQFLAESITVSAFGSLMGLLLGMLGTMAIVPIIKAITEIPFYAAYTMNTFIVIGIIALVVGIVFGTYPAIRAARLDPVEAIRRE